MKWLWPILGGYVLGRMATGETAQEAIQKTLALPRQLLEREQQRLPASEDESASDAAMYG